VFAVVLTGPPGAGKTVCLTALSDALVAHGVAHAAVDADEVAWAYPYPDLEQRCECLRAACEAHRRAGHELLLVAEVVESPEHLRAILAAVGVDDHLLVRLEAELPTLRERVVAREPPGWSGLEHLLGETEPLAAGLARLGDVHLVLDSERLAPHEIAERIRSALPG
jgi:broad-specificity NMP kinase